MKKFLSLALICNKFYYLFAQDSICLATSRQPTQKGTRATDGKPGKNYWQNHGKYNMQITVDPTQKLLVVQKQ
jgi:hypothetical protein